MSRVLRPLMALLVVLFAPVPALGANDISVSATPPTVTANGTDTTTVVAQAPVMDPGVIQQELIQRFDPGQLTVSGASGITAPQGWTLAFSSDGNVFGAAPTTAAGWAGVRAVRALGPIDSQGAYDGRQIATATAVATTPVSGSISLTPGASGDGWNVIFDDQSHVFNVFHHNGTNGVNPGIDCHTRTGDSCGPGWPFRVSPFSTGDESAGWVDSANEHLWFQTGYSGGTGFACVDISNLATGPTWCGGSAAAAFRKAGTAGPWIWPGATAPWDRSGFGYLTGWAVVGTKYFTLEQVGGKLLCLDMAANDGAGAPCAGQPYSFPSVTSARAVFGADFGYAGDFWIGTLKASGGRVYGIELQDGVGPLGICFDPGTGQACAGWETPKALGAWSNMIYEQPNALGVVEAVCFDYARPGTQSTRCFSPTGRAVTPDAGLAAFVSVPFNSVLQVDNPVTVGSKVLMSDGIWTTNNGTPRLACFDVATGASCPGWPINALNYTLTLDPDNANCLWKNTDDGSITAYDITGRVGCSSPPPWVELKASAIVPRMACDKEGAVRQWRRVTLTEPAATSYAKAYLTVYDATGAVVSSNGTRWSMVEFPAGSRQIDLTTLAVADTGPDPVFRITFTGRTTGDRVVAKVQAVGDAPQLCIPLTAVKTCPIAPARAPVPLFPPIAAVVRGEGSATFADNSSQAFTAATTTVSLGPPADADCLGAISGRATISGTSNAAIGVPVVLRDVLGNAIATTSTDGSGNYSFDRLAAGSGYYVDFGDVRGYVETTATITGDGTVRSVAAGATTTVNGVYATEVSAPDRSTTVNQGAPAVFNPFAAVGSSSGATPSQGGSYTAAEKAMVRLCGADEGDTPLSPCSLTTKSVPGEGTWTVNTDTASADVGKVTFTPDPAFIGEATPITYQVTDVPAVSTPVRDSGTLTPTVQGAAAVDDAKTTKVNTPVSGDAEANDSVSGLYRYGVTIQPSNGTVVLNADGTYTYTPNAGYTGTDTFRYAATPTVCPAGGTVASIAPGLDAVVGASLLDRTSPANLVVNGDFTDLGTTDLNGNPVDVNARMLWGPSTTYAGLQTINNAGAFTTPLRKIVIPGWTASGGGTGTYAQAGTIASFSNPAGSGASPEAAYFGNYWNWTTTPWLAWDANGFDRRAHTFTTTSTVNGGTATPLTLAQDIVTVPGRYYRLQFAQLRDPGSYSGIAAIEVGDTGRTYFRVDNAVRRITVEFRATSTSTRVAFMSWGHVKPVLGDATSSAELSLDDVIVNRCAEGTPVEANVTVTVTGPPALVPDPNTGAWDTNQVINPLTNDQAQLASGQSLTPGSVRICTTATANASCAGTSLTVAGQGTYTVNTTTGVVTFDPLPSFQGAATPIKYVATDSFGQVSSSSIAPTVLPPAPSVATADTSTGPAGQVQTRNILSNDTAPTGATITATSVRLCNPATTPAQVAPNCTATSLSVPGEGTYALNTTTGVVTFTPVAGFSGTTTGVGYQVTDSLSRVVTSSYTPTVIPPPTVVPDVNTGDWSTPQLISPFSNDTPAPPFSLASDSVRLCTTATSTAACTGTSLTVPGEGSYFVNTSTGVVTFVPLASFVGTATPVKYVIEDSAGSRSASTITPTVLPPPPDVAAPDSTTGPQGAAQSVNPLANDTTPAGLTFTATSVRLCNPAATPAELAPNCTATSMVIVGQGTYSVNTATGAVTFTPLASFTGTATAVTYAVTDSMNRKVSSTYTPTVVPPPSAVADTSTGAFDVNQVINPLANDAAGAGSTLSKSTARICVVGTAAASCSGTTLTVASQGTYTLDTTTGLVTFDPVPTFIGAATPIQYVVSDALGQRATSTIVPTVQEPPASEATPDASSGPVGSPQSVNPLANDVTAAGVAFTASTVRLCGVGQVAPGCTQTSLAVLGGTYSVNTTTGAITFTPTPGYSGKPAAAAYQVNDSVGRTVTSTYQPTVIPPPVLTDDAPPAAAWDTNQVVTPLANDTASAGTTLMPASVFLCGVSPTETPNACTRRSLTIAGEGTYTVDPVTGVITFDPLPSFAGPATPVTYVAADSLGQTSSAAIRLSVAYPPPPVAGPDQELVVPGGTATFATLVGASGAGGLASASGPGFDTARSYLCGIDPPEAAPDCSQTTVTVTGEGTYTLDRATGIVSFAADEAVAPGARTAITYVVTDRTGQTASSTLTPIVPPPPTAAGDISIGEEGRAQVMTPVANDAAGSASVPLLPGSIRLCADTETAPACSATELEVVGMGTLTVDTSTGQVRFMPVEGFNGVVPAVPYVITDVMGQTATSSIAVTVLPPPAPSAYPDSGSADFGQPVVMDVLGTDSAGTLPIAVSDPTQGYTSVGTVTLAPSTLFLCGPGESQPGCTLTSLLTADGTYAVDQGAGTITFTPAAGYFGTPRSTPTYQVCNVMGGDWQPLIPTAGCAMSTAVPTIRPPASPEAVADAPTTGWDTSVVVAVTANDTVDPALALVPTGVRLCGAGQASPNCTATSVTVPGEGTYAVDVLTGSVTFDPLPTFVGTVTTPVAYQVADSLGQVASATITPDVTPPPAPAATPQAQVVAPGGSVDFTTITGAGGLATGTGLRTSGPAQTCLVDPSDAAQCGATVTTADGTYTLNAVTGVVTYVASPGATPGDQAPVTYRVTDIIGQTATAVLTPVIPPLGAMAADAPQTPWDTDITFLPLGNDTAAAGAAFDPTTVRLCAAGQAAPNCTATVLTIPGEGTYAVDVLTGAITFDPVPELAGQAATTVGYQVADALGRATSSTIRPVVGAPPAPAANPDTKLVLPGTAVTFAAITGDAGLATGQDLQTSGAGATCLITPGSNPAECDADGSVTITGAGTFVLDAATGIVTFTADTGMEPGPLPSVTYRVTDVTGQQATSSLTPIVPAPPTLRNDTPVSAWNRRSTFSPLSNDSASAGLSMVPGSVRLCDAGESVPNCSATTVDVSGQGTYELDPSTAQVTFTPLMTFSGNATPVRYQAADTMGQVGRAVISPVVGTPLPPLARSDASSGRWREQQVLTPIVNDSADPDIALDHASVFLCAPLEFVPDCTARRLEIPDEGLYEVQSDGTVTFTPLPGFVGEATPVAYQVSDMLGQATASSITVTVHPDPLVAQPASGTAPYGTPVRLTPTAIPGTWDVDPSRTCLAAAGSAARSSTRLPDCHCNPGEVRLETPEGVYELDASTGIVIFTPTPGFIGTPANPPYIVYIDRGGQRAAARLTPTILPPPPTVHQVDAPAPAAVTRHMPRLRITTRASSPVVRVGRSVTITLRVANRGRAVATSTVTRAPIPAGFVVLRKGGGTVRGGFIHFATGDIRAGGVAIRRFVLVPTRSAAGRQVSVLGTSRGGNTRRASDPDRVRVVGPAATGAAAVTG